MSKLTDTIKASLNNGGEELYRLAREAADALEAQEKEIAAYELADRAARHLFQALAPQCKLLDKPVDVIGQIDNATVGVRVDAFRRGFEVTRKAAADKADWFGEAEVAAAIRELEIKE